MAQPAARGPADYGWRLIRRVALAGRHGTRVVGALPAAHGSTG